MGARLGVPTCTGGCGLSATRHREGCLFLGVIHFAERRFSRRAARTYLMLVARMDRESDGGYLNDPRFDWWYCHHDAVAAQRLAHRLGFSIPSRAFDAQRRECRLLASARGIRLAKYRRVYEWLNR